MNKFKVGDAVILNGNYIDPDNIVFMNRNMLCLEGKRLTIKRVGAKLKHKYIYKIKECENDYWYSEYWLDYYFKSLNTFELKEKDFLI